jgi:hypothetical protein
MMLGLDLIPTRSGFVAIEANLGIPGGLTDIVEGTFHYGTELQRRFPIEAYEWAQHAGGLYAKLDQITEEYYGTSFGNFAKKHPVMDDLRNSKMARRRGRPIPEELSTWTHFADKAFFIESLRAAKLVGFRLPDTVVATSREDMLSAAKALLYRNGTVTIKPARLWHGIGITQLLSLDELLAFTPVGGYPQLVQETIAADYGFRIDMRVLVMCGEVVAVLVRRASPGAFVCNISAGGAVMLCFSSSACSDLAFIDLDAKPYTRFYHVEWEKILLGDHDVFAVAKSTTYYPGIVLIGYDAANSLQTISRSIYDHMVEKSGDDRIPLGKESCR